jgi:large subunit ribosomal protein L21
MYAIIEDGNRQYRIAEGDKLNLDYRGGHEAGQAVSFGRILLANGGGRSLIGTPVIEGATVEAEIIEPEHKGKKLEVQKLRRRKNCRTHTGHRQKYTTVRVTAINVPGLERAEPPASE